MKARSTSDRFKGLQVGLDHVKFCDAEKNLSESYIFGARTCRDVQPDSHQEHRTMTTADNLDGLSRSSQEPPSFRHVDLSAY